MSIILDAFKNLNNLQQKDQELLVDYTRRFKTAKELLVLQLGGPIIMTRYVESMEDYNKNNKISVRRIQETAFEQFLAYIYLENSDKSKYGSLLNNLKQQQSLKHDQYPKTIVDALNVLNNHQYDSTYKITSEKRRE